MLAKTFHDKAQSKLDIINSIGSDNLYFLLINDIENLANEGSFNLKRPRSIYDIYNDQQLEQAFAKLRLEGFKCSTFSSVDYALYIYIEW